MSHPRFLCLFLLLSLVTQPVLAHTTLAMNGGFLPGFYHPLSGLDHSMAMISVGMLAQQLSHGWQWKLPTFFLTGLLLGGLIGFEHVHFTYTELGIGLSVIVLGWFVVAPHSISKKILSLFVFVFALCHGHAHGTEMGGIHPVLYFIGFMVATAMLHAVGLVFASSCQYYFNKRWLQWSGLTMMLSGLWMLS